MIPDEEWRPVSGWPSYEVSSHGRVRSLKRIATGHILKQAINAKSGYLYITLSDQGKHHWATVHGLIAKAFRGPRPNGLVVRHLDGNPQNNTISNLVYGTHSENSLDTIRHGRNRQTAKTRCPRKHRLVVPNLRVKAWQVRAARECLACHRADGYCRTHPELDLQEVSDRYYARIMDGQPEHRLMSNTYTCDGTPDGGTCSSQVVTVRAFVYPHGARRTGWLSLPNPSQGNAENPALLHFCPFCVATLQAKSTAVKRIWMRACRRGEIASGPSRPSRGMSAVVFALAECAHSQNELVEITGHAQQPISRWLSGLRESGLAEPHLERSAKTQGPRTVTFWTLTPDGCELAHALRAEQSSSYFLKGANA